MPSRRNPEFAAPAIAYRQSQASPSSHAAESGLVRLCIDTRNAGTPELGASGNENPHRDQSITDEKSEKTPNDHALPRRPARMNALDGQRTVQQQQSRQRDGVDHVVVVHVGDAPNQDPDECARPPRRSFAGHQRCQRGERQHPRGDEVEVSLQMGRHERRPAEDDGGEERRRDAPGLPVREGVHANAKFRKMCATISTFCASTGLSIQLTARAGSSVSVCWVRFAPNGWNRRGVKKTLWPGCCEGVPRPPDIPDERNVVPGTSARDGHRHPGEDWLQPPRNRNRTNGERRGMTTDGREHRVSHAAIYFAPCSRHGIGVSSRRRQHFSSAFWFDPRRQSKPPSTDLFNELHWRSIGPFRGGRTKAATGVPSQPNVFYIAAVNGGVWKTTDYGRTWKPIFDDQPTGSIGAIAVAPVDPERHLRRQRRGPAAARPLDRRRHLQVHRRRQDLDAPRPARRPADPADHRRPDESRSAVRRRARPPVRAERGARHLPLDRRRHDVREGALQGREHRRHRPGVRSRRTRITSTPCCGRRARGRGRTARFAGPAAGSSSRPTAAPPGSR